MSLSDTEIASFVISLIALFVKAQLGPILLSHQHTSNGEGCISIEINAKSYV